MTKEEFVTGCCCRGMWLFVVLLIFSSGQLLCEMRVAHIFSDHMVLQRDMPIHVWGWGDPGEKISASLNGDTRTVDVDSLGEWSLYLKPESAGGPYIVSIADDKESKIELTDIMVGDVWVASGQSNMEFPLKGFPNDPLKDGPSEIARANAPNIRLLHIKNRSSQYPVNDIAESWQVCNPETVTDFSAVAYFFGRDIQSEENVPIGLIDSTWGGTPASSWISLDVLGADASLMPVFAVRAATVDEFEHDTEERAQEKREDELALAANKKPLSRPWEPDPGMLALAWDPAGLYNGMIAPLTGFAIKGVIWYQGESDAGPARVATYERAFETLVKNWREKWGQGDFPFIYTQISSYASVPSENWGGVRDAQRRALSLANVAMAVTLDVGLVDKVHPPDKQTVAARLAAGARVVAYQESNVEYSGPIFRQATTEGKSIRVWFLHADGLTSRGPVLGFEVAGNDHHFHSAEARIEGATVVASSSDVSVPKYVRYAWPNFPSATLYNRAGLPTSTFTSEDRLDVFATNR